MDSESFYGVTLSEKEPLAQFEASDSDKMLDQKLIIKQICLGAEAKHGEFNVIQAYAKVSDKDNLMIPIAVLKAGETRVLCPQIEFSSASVTFKLIQGTGPVYIHGQHVINEFDVEEWQNEDEDVGSYDDELQPQINGKNSHKRK